MITIRKLVKYYGDYLALNHLDLHIGKGVIFGLLGPNGAGKTSLISILNGLTNFSEGEIEVFGMPLLKGIKAIRKRCAFIPQTLAFYDNLSVIENLRFFGGIQKISGRTLSDNIDYAVSVNRLHSLLDQKAVTLSGGQKRRLNIAVGLLNDPEIIYFDEPTVGIDPESRNDILETIRSFKENNKTVIYTSHYMPEIEKICDEVAIINSGQIIKQGALSTLLQGEKSESVVIELVCATISQLSKVCKKIHGVEVVDAAKLVLHSTDALKIGNLLSVLEKEDIKLRHLSYDSTNLEALFIRLTSPMVSDV